jgi:hypothetical protein
LPHKPQGFGDCSVPQPCGRHVLSSAINGLLPVADLARAALPPFATISQTEYSPTLVLAYPEKIPQGGVAKTTEN